MKTAYTTFAICFVLAVNSMPTFAQQPTDFAKLEKRLISHDGLERSYYLRLPTDFGEDEMLPVVFALHGGGRSDGKDLATRLNFSTLADKDRFIVVYPSGSGNQWNDGRGQSSRKTRFNKDVDDVGFLSTLIDHIVSEYHADASRVYFTGPSNGGMMSFRIGCELTHKVAAIAPIIANIPSNIAETKSPTTELPVLIMNGTEDSFMPWKGGEVTVFRKKHGRVISTKETVAYWSRHNGLSDHVGTRDLPDVDANDGSTVRITRFGEANAEAPVVLYEIRGGGHAIPGMRPRPALKRLLGNVNQDFSTTEVVWSFFKEFQR